MVASRVVQMTGMDHDHILVCGRSKEAGVEGFGKESDPKTKARGLCEKIAHAAAAHARFQPVLVPRREPTGK